MATATTVGSGAPAESDKMAGIMRRLLTASKVFSALIVLGVFALAVRPVEDPDFWWHLATGRYIVEHHAVPHSDPFSFTRAGQPWVAHEWLFDLAIFGIYRAAGWGGLILLFAACTAVTFGLLLLRCPGRPDLAGILVLLAAFASAPTWGVRPQTISMLLASVFLVMLDRSEQSPSLMVWLVPLTLLWANLHAGYALGIVLIGLWLCGRALDLIFGFSAGEAGRAPLRRLALLLAGCLAIVPLNPNGFRLLAYPLETLRSPSMQAHIAEWFSPSFHRPEFLPLLALLMLLILALATSQGRTRPCDLLLLCATAWGALSSMRLIPVFVLVATPVVAAAGAAGRWRRDTASGHQELVAPSLARSSLHVAMLAAVVAFVGLQARRTIARQPGIEAQQFPAGAVSFLRDHPELGPVWNYYDWGGYLIWKLYPERRVFIDGRADVYGDELLDSFATTYRVSAGWEENLERWHITALLLPADSALAAALQRLGWEIVYRDPRALILSSQTGMRSASEAAFRAEILESASALTRN